MARKAFSTDANFLLNFFLHLAESEGVKPIYVGG